MVATGSNAVLRLPDGSLLRSGLFSQWQRDITRLLQHRGNRLVDKIMYQPSLMKTHLMLGRMNVDIYLMRIHFQIQHIGRQLIVFQLILIRLTNGMINQPIAHHPTVDVAILHFAKLACPLRIRHPAADAEIAMLPGNRQRMLQEGGATNAGQTPLMLAFFFCRAVLTH